MIRLVNIMSIWREAGPGCSFSSTHLGLYDDTQVVDLRRYVAEIHAGGTTVLVMLDQLLPVLTLDAHALADVREAFIWAAWRARAIGSSWVRCI
jgi:hypothetical protein